MAGASPGALRVSCTCPPVSPGALPQSYLHAFAYGNTIYRDLWSHLQEVGGGWLLLAAPPDPALSPLLPQLWGAARRDTVPATQPLRAGRGLQC